MSDEPEELDFEERRKRLEQLFAAEPHLSPTMRARQLYDEPEHKTNGNHAAFGSGTAAFSPQPQITEFDDASVPAEALAGVEPPLEDGMISLEEARGALRERANPALAAEYAAGQREPDALDSLRDSVLACWRRDIYSDR
jgi:hypothetical protein